ncbi:MAG TPA: acyl-CoA thioester hydrolase/BAAT C-terminal domain-containing protein [Longimicrobiales bacterium]|nr:acyl-CoA thioester hydrolase/BAAT C-terminal domain-containing protein [Longimicrobiales bacterium]
MNDQVPQPRRRSTAVVTAVLAALLVACGDSPSGPRHTNDIDLDALFQPATAAELAAVEAEWAARTPTAASVVEEASSLTLMAGGLGTVRVFSHVVDGHRHYGATLAPTGAAAGSLPVVVFAHGGDTGINMNDVALVTLVLGETVRNFVYVVPSFRSERLMVGEASWTSEGAPSPWDRDVDDALAFLDVALERVPEADASRIGVLGASRGGMAGLLMAIRDPRIRLVSELAGPTDFFGPWLRGLVQDARDGSLQPLPGIHVLDERFMQPLFRGEMTPAEFRLELVRRSPVLWADRLPPVQVHHGTADDIVPVSQAHSLVSALADLQRDVGDEVFLYPGAGHNILELREVDARIISFLHRLRQ